MKFFHLSDLHLGKRLNKYSLIEDQRYVLAQVLSYIDEEHPDAVVIAGDVYDKSIPSAEAVQLFDSFLVEIAKRDIAALVISGNHDSPERNAFGAQLMHQSKVFLSPVFDGNVQKVTLQDSFGEVNFYLLPFVKPVQIAHLFPEENISDLTDAMQVMVNKMDVDASQRNVLIAHQFVTGGELCDSEEMVVGGADNVNASLFSIFDYTALGHLHKAQWIEDEKIRYSGTLLKYSFSEIVHHKSFTVVEMNEKGNLEIRTIPVVPQHDLREIRGEFFDLINKDNGNPEDYLLVTLTDEDEVPDVLAKLRQKYPNIMHLRYDNSRTRHTDTIEQGADVENRLPLELISEFFEQQNGSKMTTEQYDLVSKLIKQIWEE